MLGLDVFFIVIRVFVVGIVMKIRIRKGIMV